MSAITPLVDPRCTALGLTVTPPAETDGLHWELAYLWLTENGGWDDVPNFARPFQNDHLGGDHHVYVLGRRLTGFRAQEPDLFVLGWPDGHHKFSPKGEQDWWGNAVINAGFNWSEVAGPYFAQMNALNSSIVRGIGLPYPPYPWERRTGLAKTVLPDCHFWDEKTMVGDGVAANVTSGLHTSFFMVFQEVEGYAPEPPPPDQFQRMLEKAEAAADKLAAYNREKYAEAAKIYLGIAELLSWL